MAHSNASANPLGQRAFVTGGAGFIGSQVVERLLGEGYRVTAYDNLSSGSRDLIAAHLDNPRFTFFHGDILDPVRLGEAMAGHDVVWHLAANTDIRAGSRETDV